MSNIRDLGQKISSLQNIQKVTRAMNMISSIKLRKLFESQGPLHMFQQKTDEIMAAVLNSLGDLNHPLTAGYEKPEKVHLVMFTADKGLCGVHNSSVQKAVDKFVREQDAAGIDVEISSIGKKGSGFCRHKGWDLFRVSDIGERTFTKKELFSLSEEIFRRFMNGTVHRVYAAGNFFYSALQQEVELEQLLPLSPGPDDLKEGSPVVADMQFEPEKEEFIINSAPLFLKNKLYIFLMNSLLSEHSARMTAMENATNNSEDLIAKYINTQNHARQAAITNELIEIVSGKEALKG